MGFFFFFRAQPLSYVSYNTSRFLINLRRSSKSDLSIDPNLAVQNQSCEATRKRLHSTPQPEWLDLWAALSAISSLPKQLQGDPLELHGSVLERARRFSSANKLSVGRRDLDCNNQLGMENPSSGLCLREISHHLMSHGVSRSICLRMFESLSAPAKSTTSLCFLNNFLKYRVYFLS